MVMGDLVREADVAVVGCGPGGYAAAFRAAELGLDAIVVDATARLGGACLYEGCIPSKALLHVASLIAEAERAAEIGVEFGPPRIGLDALRKWKDERVVGRLARGLTGVARSKGVEVVAGRRSSRARASCAWRATPPRRSASSTRLWPPGRSPADCPGSASPA